MLDDDTFRLGAEQRFYHADLRDWRRERGLRQRDLAEMAGIPSQKITAIENFREYPTAVERAALARITGIPEHRLFPGWLREWASGTLLRQEKVVEVSPLRLSQPELRSLPDGCDVADVAIEHVTREQLRHSASVALDRLTPRERDVIERHFGLYDDPKTLPAIGRDLGLSQERIRQLEHRAMTKLRAPNVPNPLRQFVSWADQDDERRDLPKSPPVKKPLSFRAWLCKIAKNAGDGFQTEAMLAWRLTNVMCCKSIRHPGAMRAHLLSNHPGSDLMPIERFQHLYHRYRVYLVDGVEPT